MRWRIVYYLTSTCVKRRVYRGVREKIEEKGEDNKGGGDLFLVGYLKMANGDCLQGGEMGKGI